MTMAHAQCLAEPVVFGVDLIGFTGSESAMPARKQNTEQKQVLAFEQSV